MPVTSVERGPRPKVDRELLKEIVLKSSARLRGLGLRRGTVSARSTQGHDYLVTTEGMRIVQPSGYAVVYAFVDLVRPDGLRLFNRRQWLAPIEAALPPLAKIAAEVEAMGKELVARAQAKPVAFYEGPLILEGEAAADFFRYLLPAELQGTPPIPEAGRSYQEQTRRGPRLGRRLLPEGWSVWDDPAAFQAGEAGGYRYDREGVPGERVDLVQDGYVRDLLMSRVPRAEKRSSNGHARGTIGGRWSARLSAWTVQPKKQLSARAFERSAKTLRSRSGQDRILVVRAVEQGWTGAMPRPTEAVWRYPDGREEPVLALEFQGIDRRTLRDIVATSGGSQRRVYLGPNSPRGRAGTVNGLPMVLTAPKALLIDEVEVAFPGAQQAPPIRALLPLPTVAE